MKYDEYRRVHAMVAADLLKLPHVHTVGLGVNSVGGVATGDVALVVVVDKKLPRGELAPGACVPRELLGVPTDVIEVSPAAQQMPCLDTPCVEPSVQAGAIDSTRTDEDAEHVRPLVGGLRFEALSEKVEGKPVIAGGDIFPLTKFANTSGAGTLGCIAVMNGSGRAVGLTAYHVLHNHGPLEEPVAKDLQINMYVGSPRQSRGSCWGCCPDHVVTELAVKRVYNRLADAALVALRPGTEYSTSIREIGAIAGVHDITCDDIRGGEYRVTKYGMRTGLTTGTVVCIDATGTRPMQAQSGAVLQQQGILVRPAAGQIYFSKPGDSGSVVVNRDREIVGLLVAGSKPPVQGWTYCDRIADVMSQLEITIPTDRPSPRFHTVPGATAAASAPALAPRIQERAARVREELCGMEWSRVYVSLFDQHQQQVLALLERDRRAAVRWHRLGGPKIMRALSAMALSDEQVPKTIEGRTWESAVGRAYAVLREHGSADLRADIDAHGALLQQLGGLSYSQAIQALAERAQKGARP